MKKKYDIEEIKKNFSEALLDLVKEIKETSNEKTKDKEDSAMLSIQTLLIGGLLEAKLIEKLKN